MVEEEEVILPAIEALLLIKFDSFFFIFYGRLKTRALVALLSH